MEQSFGQWIGPVAPHVRALFVRVCGSSLSVAFFALCAFLFSWALCLSLLRRGWRAASLLSSRVCLRAAAVVVVFARGFARLSSVCLFSVCLCFLLCLFVCCGLFARFVLFVCVFCVCVCLASVRSHMATDGGMEMVRS